MLRYKLRTLLIVLALGPPVLSGAWFAGVMMGIHNVALIGAAVAPMLVLAFGFAMYWFVADSEGH